MRGRTGCGTLLPFWVAIMCSGCQPVPGTEHTSRLQNRATSLLTLVISTKRRWNLSTQTASETPTFHKAKENRPMRTFMPKRITGATQGLVKQRRDTPYS